MGHDPLHWGCFSRITPQGVPQADGRGTLARKRRGMSIPPAGGSDGGVGTAGGEDLYLPPPEHSHTVYCEQVHYGPVSIGGAEAGFKGDQSVVGA